MLYVCSRLCNHHPDWDIEHSGTSEHLLVPLSNRLSLHPHLQRVVGSLTQEVRVPALHPAEQRPMYPLQKLAHPRTDTVPGVHAL